MPLPRPALLAAPLAATVLVSSLALAAPASAGDRTARVDGTSATATPSPEASPTATPATTTTATTPVASPVATPSATSTARTRVRSVNALLTAVARSSATPTVTVRSGATTTTYALAPRVRVSGLVRSPAALVPGLRVHVGGTPTATGPVADAVVVPATRVNRLVLAQEATRATLRKQAAERAAKARAEAVRRAEGAKKAGGRKARG